MESDSLLDDLADDLFEDAADELLVGLDSITAPDDDHLDDGLDVRWKEKSSAASDDQLDDGLDALWKENRYLAPAMQRIMTALTRCFYAEMFRSHHRSLLSPRLPLLRHLVKYSKIFLWLEQTMLVNSAESAFLYVSLCLYRLVVSIQAQRLHLICY
jgi:hypothetical protein